MNFLHGGGNMTKIGDVSRTFQLAISIPYLTQLVKIVKKILRIFIFWQKRAESVMDSALLGMVGQGWVKLTYCALALM